MKKKNFLLSLLGVITASMLSVGLTSCGGDGDDDPKPRTENETTPTPTPGSSSLVVSPYQLQLTSNAKATGTFTITTTGEWTIYNDSQWLTLSAISGSGNATITVTADDENRSDEKRSATIRVTSGDTSKEITVDQLPAYTTGCRVTVSNELILSNGFYADLTFDKEVYGYVEGYFYASALKTKTETEIYDEVKSSNGSLAKDLDFALNELPNASTEYIYCVIGYDKNRNYGPMTIHHFSTKSSSTSSDASIGSISYNSSYWTYTITMQSRCHHFYQLKAINSDATTCYNYADIMLAYIIRDRIGNPNYPGYDYSINAGSMRTARETTDNAFFICTWGVNDKDEFSGNIRSSYRNISSNVAPSYTNKEKNFGKLVKPTRRELNALKNNFVVNRVE